MRALFLLFCCLPSLVLAKSPQEIFETASKSVVLIEHEKWTGDQWERSPIGSGVVVAKDRVLTNCHVAKAAKDGPLWLHRKGANALVFAYPYARAKNKDLCLLRPRQPIGEPSRIGSASLLKVGTPVYAIGAPQGLELSLSNGVVSQLRGDEKAPIIQTTAPISPGSSGGGLFDSEGRLVGITAFYLEGGQNLNFALPVEWLGELVKEENQVFNRIGIACIELLDQSVEGSANLSDSEIDQCIQLVSQQKNAAFIDNDAPKPAISQPTTEAKTPPLPELFRVGSTGGGSFVVYLKPPTVRQLPNGKIQAWTVGNYESPQYDSRGKYYYQSTMALNEYDCAVWRSRLLSLAHYSELNGRGQLLWSASMEPHETKYQYALPGSVKDGELKSVCSIWSRE